MTLTIPFLNNYKAGICTIEKLSVCITSFTNMHNTPSEVNTDQVHFPFCLRTFNAQSSNVTIHKEIQFDLYLFCYFSEQANRFLKYKTSKPLLMDL